MARKAAVKKESNKKAQTKASNKKSAVGKRPVKKPKKKSVAGKAIQKQASTKKITQKAIKTLLAKGKKQGYLTYDEINALLPDDMLSPEQIDETLMLFDDNSIEVVDEKHFKKVVNLKK